MGLVNYLRFGSFTEFGYGHYSFLSEHGGAIGLIGLLVSPGVGLIFYFPITLLLPLAMKYLYHKDKGILFLSVYVILSFWLYVGTLSYWEPFSQSGGVAWGPRYLIPTLPFITLALGVLLQRLKTQYFRNRLLVLKLAIVFLCFAGFYVNLLGKLVWFMYGLIYAWGTDELWRKDRWPIIMIWHPFYSPIVFHMKAITENYVSSLQPDKYSNTSWHWVTYGLAPCQYDTYIFCKFGVPSTIGISTIIIVVFILINNEISLIRRLRISH